MTSKLQRVLHIVELCDVGICEFAPDGELLQANEAFFKLTGYPRDTDAPAFAWLDNVYEPDRAAYLERWDGLVAGTATSLDIRVMPKKPVELGTDHSNTTDENFTWLAAAVSPVVDPKTGEVTNVSLCLTDITASKRSQYDAIQRADALERARTSEQRLMRFADLASCPVFIYGADHKVCSCAT